MASLIPKDGVNFIESNVSLSVINTPNNFYEHDFFSENGERYINEGYASVLKLGIWPSDKRITLRPIQADGTYDLLAGQDLLRTYAYLKHKNLLTGGIESAVRCDLYTGPGGTSTSSSAVGVGLVSHHTRETLLFKNSKDDISLFRTFRESNGWGSRTAVKTVAHKMVRDIPGKTNDRYNFTYWKRIGYLDKMPAEVADLISEIEDIQVRI